MSQRGATVLPLPTAGGACMLRTTACKLGPSALFLCELMQGTRRETTGAGQEREGSAASTWTTGIWALLMKLVLLEPAWS